MPWQKKLIRFVKNANIFLSFKYFNCGIKAMDDFIHSGLASSIRNHYCNLYSVTLNDEVVAMFSLSFDSLELDLDSLEEILDNHSATNKPLQRMPL